MSVPIRRRRIRKPAATPAPSPREVGALSYRRWFPGMTCGICGELIRIWQSFNQDHIVPMSRGGKRGKVNKVYAHCLCNAVKGDRYPFSLRTLADREAVWDLVSERTYDKLMRVWAGENV